MTLYEDMVASADGALTLHVCNRFGAEGAAHLQRLLIAVRNMYKYVPASGSPVSSLSSLLRTAPPCWRAEPFL